MTNLQFRETQEGVRSQGNTQSQSAGSWGCRCTGRHRAGTGKHVAYSLVLEFYLLCDCVVCFLSRCPWWRGGRVAQVCLTAPWRCSTSSQVHILNECLQSMYNFVILIVHTVILLCRSILCTRHQLHVCPSWESDPSSVALPQVSSNPPQLQLEFFII